ncbi:hypothetical protein ACFO9E_25705 [Streptomyces maoxianensis]|uniref:Recombinase zinc beta ribbon domain-containing protein n=1 Tax=Streptomyces maoxianensis TaxID=1459942 RepID=A0ABV9GDQ5_9ACTN
MNVNDVVQERIAAAKAKDEQQKKRRAELAAARQHGLKARHATKMRRMGIRVLGYCASCAAPLTRGTYVLCSKGCGARLCRPHRRCINKHDPHNCPKAARDFTDSPQEAS